MTPFVPEPATSGELSAVTRTPWPRDPRFLVGSDGTILGLRGEVVEGTITPDGHRLLSYRTADGRGTSTGQHVVVSRVTTGRNRR